MFKMKKIITLVEHKLEINVTDIIAFKYINIFLLSIF